MSIKFKLHYNLKMFFKKEKEEVKNTLEVSIVGGGFERYIYEGEISLEKNEFIFIKTTKEPEKEVLAKFRIKSNKKTEHKILSLRIAEKNEVIRIIKDMVKEFIYEKEENDIKIVKVLPDFKNGIFKFQFTAEKRYDFKIFAPKLAKILHVHIEFEQIGARDYAREIGGIGKCGKEICCKKFLKQIPSITLEMARNQYIFAVPDHITGICGRLLCCLKYEFPFYEEASKDFPKIGEEIKTPKGIGKVKEINVIKGYFKIEYEDGSEEIVYKEERW